ncbi:MAG: hypothetical protein IT163_09915 [Bryobacterales bacterium]|nr:hypothetical protein [Bryobacterales bacterium]
MQDLIRVQPVVDGLLNGLGLASRIRSAAMQQAEFEERKRARMNQEKREDERLQMDRDRIADTRAERTRTNKRQDEQDQRQRTSDDISLATNPALVPLEPGQTTRTRDLFTGALPQEAQLFAPTSVEAPVGNVIQQNGRSYDIKGQSEIKSDRMNDLRTAMGLKLQETAALDAIRNPMVAVEGYPGMVPRSATGSAINAVTRGADRVAANQRAGARNAVTMSAAQLRASGGDKGGEQKRKDDLDALVKEERGLQERVLSLRKAVLTGTLPTREGTVVELDDEARESYKADLKLAEDQLKEIRGRKVSRGFSSEADVAPRTPAKKQAAAPRTATGGRNPYR